MLYNSIEYFVFFSVLLIIYWSAVPRFRNIILIISSLVFYAYWSFPFLLHYCVILTLNYPLLQMIIKRKSRAALIGALVLDIGNLAFFKYFYFMVRSLEFVLPGNLTGTLSQITPENGDVIPVIILPLAISFYTFQIIAFHMDAYRGEVTEVPGFWKYFLFISYFPQHIAGPIIRHEDLLKQLDEPRNPAAVDVERGLALIGMGLVKKILIADLFAQLALSITHSPEKYDPPIVFLGCVFFAIQVYSDFSGYSDIARGSSLLLGFELPVNFRGPFFQLSYQEHWQRWHITLSFWLRDYLYIALGGNRKGKFKSHLFLLITFVLGGLWHGAGWGFVLWGVAVGMFLVIERILREKGWISSDEKWGRREAEATSTFSFRTFKNFLRMSMILTLIVLGGIFFNAGTDLSLIVRNFKALFSPAPNTIPFGVNSYHGFVFLIFLFLHWLEYNDFRPIFDRREKWRALEKPALVGFALLLLFTISWKATGNTPFVYFQF
ncbi:MAG: MBOAT family protein [Spirochaetia bacterium]|nr:MBOAT family protein [Spirochaetia bacterium]